VVLFLASFFVCICIFHIFFSISLIHFRFTGSVCRTSFVPNIKCCLTHAYSCSNKLCIVPVGEYINIETDHLYKNLNSAFDCEQNQQFTVLIIAVLQVYTF
jgi:hypothetical protein